MMKGQHGQRLRRSSFAAGAGQGDSSSHLPEDEPDSSGPAFTVRHARLSDYEALCRIFAEGDEFHVRALPDVFRTAKGPARSRDFIAGILADPNVTLLVAEAPGEIVGIVTVGIRTSPDVPILVPRRFAYVDSLVVRESFRRQGVGRLLMEHVHRWTLERDLPEVELNVWEFNTGARSLYEALGYEPSRRTLRRRL